MRPLPARTRPGWVLPVVWCNDYCRSCRRSLIGAIVAGMTEAEYREALNSIEEQLTVLYRQRRKLTQEFADDHPAVLPPTRFQSDVQRRVSRCPRCGGSLNRESLPQQ